MSVNIEGESVIVGLGQCHESGDMYESRLWSSINRIIRFVINHHCFVPRHCPFIFDETWDIYSGASGDLRSTWSGSHGQKRRSML